MKREQRKNDINNRIIVGLLKLMETKTLDSITSIEISKIAAISKRTLYKYYESKTEMYLALVKYSFLQLNQELCYAYSITADHSFEEQIVKLGTVYLDFMTTNDVMANLIVEYNESLYYESHSRQVEEIREIANTYEISILIKKAVANGVRFKVNEEILSLFIWSSLLGFSKLIKDKGIWLERYYGHDVNTMKCEHLELMKNFLKEVIV
ncbi:nucleoid occlusion factor SlmA [Clostridium homopropionicum DSM 5847]|uniref:Nucleoid occlusion factor SlmA n=1 Tax=Clostridium homopropionicum DSM 5847 TaxID=1121318 RepID=A0A0L6ZA20_9CLOT|nr:TetR/AcrR family transcriptional regulator [Clostridium homopropionicum]KOA19815.1 nucleoid occlusion factor SlmA [Clostridium homopropionicum DSM 5847]SFF76864.1 transcriptional regulator, TetR family [Clostridium homopropionicum]